MQRTYFSVQKTEQGEGRSRYTIPEWFKFRLIIERIWVTLIKQPLAADKKPCAMNSRVPRNPEQRPKITIRLK